MIQKNTLIAILLVLIAVASSLAYVIAAFNLNISGNQTVQITSTAKIVRGDINGTVTGFVIAGDNQSASLILPTLTHINDTNIIHVWLQNIGSVNETFTATATTSNPTVATVTYVTSWGTNQVAPGQLVNLNATVIALGNGTALIAIAISG